MFENMKKLGFGLMRLPKLDGGCDIEQCKKMVDMYLESGCNYFDTAWLYKGNEKVMNEILVKRYPRESYFVASKLAAWSGCKSREDALAQFESSLNDTGLEYFDCYLLHNLGESRTEFFEKWKLWDFVKEQKAAGKIRHIGFSFHSNAEELEAILKAHPEAEFVQLQINYADWEDNKIQSRRCYEVARKYKKPIIIMEPVKGGLLANPPEAVADILKNANPAVSYASWALRFAASLEGVVMVLSGMSNVEQMADNLSFMHDFKPMTDAELQTVAAARAELAKVPLIPCTFCDYCAKGCPENIGISGTFGALNALRLYQDKKFALGREDWSVTYIGKNRADKCIKCGKCEKLCPQHIPIRQYLAEAVEKLIK